MSTTTFESNPALFSDPSSEAGFDDGSNVYKSVSQAAVLSLVLAGLGALSIFWAGLLVLPLAGLFFGIISIINIRKYPMELTGLACAKLGTVASIFLLIVPPAYHAYVYANEVPPGFDRIAFEDLKSPIKAIDLPPASALDLNGKSVFLKGYMHPSSLDAPMAKKFILVPDLGTCCFGGQPPLTHMIEVTLTGEKRMPHSMRKMKLAGTLKVSETPKPIQGLQGVFYELKAEYVQ